jgi:hypothetical protein
MYDRMIALGPSERRTTVAPLPPDSDLHTKKAASRRPSREAWEKDG